MEELIKKARSFVDYAGYCGGHGGARMPFSEALDWIKKLADALEKESKK